MHKALSASLILLNLTKATGSEMFLMITTIHSKETCQKLSDTRRAHPNSILCTSPLCNHWTFLTEVGCAACDVWSYLVTLVLILPTEFTGRKPTWLLKGNQHFSRRPAINCIMLGMPTQLIFTSYNISRLQKLSEVSSNPQMQKHQIIRLNDVISFTQT